MRETPARRAAWIYAVAGWIGSSAGVGLAEHQRVLPGWAGPVAVAVLALALWQGRERTGEARTLA